MGGRPKKTIAVNDVESIKELSMYYKKNIKDDPLVCALNALPTEERNIFLVYLLNDNEIKSTANAFNVSSVWMSGLLKQIKNKIKSNLNDIS